jgi:hypothetical protein
VDRELSPQVLNNWLGDRLLVKYMTGPDADPEGPEFIPWGALLAILDIRSAKPDDVV